MRSTRALALAVVAIAVAATALVFPRAAAVEIRADLTALLPRAAQAASDYRYLLETIGASERVFAVLELAAEDPTPDDREALAEAACTYAGLLAEREAFRSATCGFEERDESFLTDHVLPRALLLVPTERLEATYAPLWDAAGLRARARTMRETLASPAGAAVEPWLAADPLGLASGIAGGIADVGGLASEGTPDGAAGVEFSLDGGIVSASGRRALVIAAPRADELDVEAGAAVERDLRDALAELRTVADLDLTVHTAGGPLYALHDSRTIRADVLRILAGAGVVIALLVGAYFRGVAIPFAAIAAVAAGVVWTAAAVSFTTGAISVVGASCGAILVGLGIDHGTHLGAAFVAARREGARPGRAAWVAWRRAGPAVAAAAGTTAAGFLVLTRSTLDPLRELGRLVALGTVATVIATVTLGGALAVATSRASGASRPREAERSREAPRFAERLTAAIAAASVRRRGTVLAAAAVLVALAVAGVGRVEFSSDPRGFRTEPHPAEPAERALAEDFEQGLDSFAVLVEADDEGAALDGAARAARLARETLGDGVRVRSPSDLFVAGALAEDRARRASALWTPERSETFREALREAGLDPRGFARAFATLDAVAAGTPPDPVPSEARPEWLRESLQTLGDRTVATITIDGPTGAWPDGAPATFVDVLRAEIPGVRVASLNAVARELRDEVANELARLGAFALAVVAAVVLVSFRLRVIPAVLALVPAMVGALALVGGCGWLGIPLNIFSVAAAPIVLGIGIDDGLHALHGAKVHGGIVRSIRRVGGPIALTTATTAIGFASLALGRLPAIRAGGVAIAIGVTACFLATVSLLPALARRETAPDGRTSGVDGDADANDPGPGDRDAAGGRVADGAALADSTARSRHAPRRGRAARVLGAFHFSGVFWYRFHLWGVRVAPRWIAPPLIHAFTATFTTLLVGVRGAIASNLEAVLGPATGLGRWRRARRTVWNFAWCLTERYEWIAGVAHEPAEIERRDVWERVNEDPRGFLLVTAHIGGWEIGSGMPADRAPRIVHIVREPELDPEAQAFFEDAIRTLVSDRYRVHFATDDLKLSLALREALAAGDVVALQGDRPRGFGRTVSTTLFGRPFEVPSGPFVLARATGCAIVPVFAFRIGRRRYRLAFRDPVEVARTSDRRADVRAAAQRMTTEIEWAISQEPHQWFCFREVWGEGAGEPAVTDRRGTG